MSIEFTLTAIPYEDKSILEKLIQLYRYDSSECEGHSLTEHGVYSYKYLDHQWTEDYRRPLLIKVNGEIAGFVLLILDVPKAYTKLNKAETTHVMSDFFIMRKFRKQGLGLKVAHQVFNQYRGNWEIKQTAKNIAAQHFWRKVVSGYRDGEVLKEDYLDNEHWKGPVIAFKGFRESQL
ncbi:acetyltransferase [Alkalihalobacillus alcalophilus ATCC 27647 = CGMCC 1.3604]|uniref:Acetyltransferase n=1 Tax=Alkalihalobacillus alcalophilus ATCC 27647 = CGMCC 1.3604 TaxID=1218173 RepID=A0A094WNI0_ALKAL|nr:GNAT family N-acetyltransferase [Alkalihalobacillus alcalophilus]KGA98396.1 GNAT family acetyltransferase [Alkalihalobacillus alcalophilus ATCC 27647 = CGMCC 1.3604]MED1563932.1 GNAT family N-acetyltransferase [Alkalihalobacillus alcalophilus]THG91581.1 acetyltransferase [Alkalihalobacillus alcalophilus ATCC 27647 = CGMCC 1.3604]